MTKQNVSKAKDEACLCEDCQVIGKAVFGLIGDNVKEVTLDNLYSRCKDKSEQLGLFPMSFPHFIDTLRRNNYKIIDDTKKVQLPKRIAL